MRGRKPSREGGNAMGLNGWWGGVVWSVRPRAEPGQGLARILDCNASYYLQNWTLTVYSILPISKT